MKLFAFIIVGVTIFLISFSEPSYAQYYKQLKGDPFERKVNVHSGNQVRTTFFNYGLVGRRSNQPEDFGGEWPINSGHEYVGDISVMVGAEVFMPDGNRITPVTVADGPRGNNEVDPNDPTVFWGWEPLGGFADPDSNVVAMSHKPETWPSSWPDRQSDSNDPGWPGQWNGFFGKDQFNADQESYWVMDDSRDMEFIRNPGFYPDSTDTTRGGLGLLANVRGLQWSQTLAQNTIFWLYDITNVSTTNYDKTVFGMIVGTTIGGDGDTEDDNSKFLAREDITYSWDYDNVGNGGWQPVGWMGYAFLESPGNRLNGFDDDNDGQGGGGSVIAENLLMPRIVNVGDEVVLIDYDDPWFSRNVTTFPSNGISFTVNGKQYQINPGDTLKELPYNNIDDNLNGLIDENTELPNDGLDNNNNGLIDEPNPHLALLYKDFLTGDTLNLMIDEGRDDGIDNDGDWNADVDDVGLDGKPNTHDMGEDDGVPTSGYQPLGPNGELIDTGLPGEPNIDKTDIDESDQIGLTSFFFFAPFNFVKLNNDKQLWNTLRPGYFDEGEQNKDGDFIYGTGYFPLRTRQTERISLAFFFAEGNAQNNALNDILRTKETVQLIYNNNYNFAKAPQLPSVKAYAGNGKVTLYWDSQAEQSFDKLSQVAIGEGFDFEGYKIYRATYPTWDETGTVTNVFGNRVADVPIAQFDKVDADSGFFPAVDPQLGSVFYLGDNTGLVHTFTDTTVQNGFTYFYAVTAYDKGINTLDQILQPAETSKFAAITQAGEIQLGKNVISVRPEAPASGYVPPGETMETLKHVSGDGTGQVQVEIIDPNEVKDKHEYEISFSDSSFLRTTYAFSVVDISGGNQDTLVNESPNVDIDATIVDGVKIRIRNDWATSTDKQNVRWSDTTRYILLPKPGTGWSRFAAGLAQGKPYPAQYALIIGEFGIDTTAGIRPINTPPQFGQKFPTNYRIKNMSENRYVRYSMFESGDTPSEKGKLDYGDIIAMFEMNGTTPVLTYQIVMASDSSAELPQIGDTLFLPVKKPFLSYDVFRYRVEGPKENRQIAKTDLDRIKVVPNPYIATAAWEPRNTFSTGRGERSIHFIHLPQNCTIRIYNMRGELVDTIEHNSPVTNGTADWDLLSRDELSVAYGVYIYHVEAPGIGEKIGKFAVIK